MAYSRWWRLNILLWALVFLTMITCAKPVSANEIRAWCIDAWGAGILNQSQVNTLLGAVGTNQKGQIRDANCNTVVVQVRRRADVCYPSSMGEPYMSGLSPSNFNALQAVINAAHDTTGGKQRVDVFAWIVTFPSSTSQLYYQHNNPADPDNYWVTLTDSGSEDSDKAMDPGHPKCEEYLVNVCMDIINNYDIDGFNFDYIRFLASNEGYNPTSLARFHARYPSVPYPAVPTNNPDFQQWRRDQVTALVRKVYAKTQASKPNVKISGSFITGAPGPSSSTRNAFYNTRPYYQYYSDWDSWMQEGIVDIAFPMTYFDQASYPTDFTKWINFEKDRKANRHVAITPGNYLNTLNNSIYQLLRTRDQSPSGNYAQGFCGYSYRVPFDGGTWSGFAPTFTSQVTPTQANIPAMSWKTTPTKGHLMGTVTYASNGEWADGATVSITGPTARSMLTDGTGFYAFIDLPAGTYTITVSKTGYTTQIVSQAVTVGAMATKNVVLPGAGCSYPVISGVSAQGITAAAATIVWQTNIASDSRVEYGTTISYGSTVNDASNVTSHSVPLSGLSNNTTYHYRVSSQPPGGCRTYSDDFTFKTQQGVSVPDIIIESRNLAGAVTPAPEYVENPAWLSSTAKSSAPPLSGSATQGSRYLTSSNYAKTATFVPNIIYAGPYDVYATWGASSSGSFANFKVTAGGSVVYNQNWNQNQDQPYENNWNLLGQFTFNSGQSASNASVMIDGNASSFLVGSRVMSDAVKFVFRGNVAGDTQAPSTPTGLAVSVNGTTSDMHVSWNAATDNVAVTGYNLYRNDILYATTTTELYFDLVGLAPNTSATFKVSAFDAAGNESVLSGPVTGVTLSDPPTGANITCDRDTSTWYTSGGFRFTAVGGFGTGTVAKYKYAWDANPSYTFTESESEWASGILLVSPSTSGGYFLHLKGYNSAGVANGTANLGPYHYETTPPTQPVVTDDGNYTSSLSTLQASWVTSDPESGVAKSEYRIVDQNSIVIRDWTDVGAAVNVNATGLSLTQGKTYTFQVRATNNVLQTSTVGSSNGIKVVQGVATIGALKTMPNNTEFVLTSAKPVSANFGAECYISEVDRSSGILVQAAGPGVGTGAVVGGKLTTTSGGERAVTSADVKPGAFIGAPLALKLATNRVGGAAIGYYTPAIGYPPGLQNTGLFITVWGKVTYSDTPSGVFYIDDGSKLNDTSGRIGLRVVTTGSVPSVMTDVIVTGISSGWKPSGYPYMPMVRAINPGGWQGF